MGLIKAIAGTISGDLANQWKDYFVMDSMENTTLIKRSEHMISHRSSNKRGDSDIISKDSKIIVNEGQGALLVSQGKIIDVALEPGAYEFDEGASASFFAGQFKDVFKEGWERFKFGGEKPMQQRVYYVNLKEILGLKFGTPTPIPFRVLDKNIGLDIDTSLRCNGNYTIHVSNPVVLYVSIAGNVEDEYSINDMTDQLRGEFVQALQPALGSLSAVGVRPSGLPAETTRISEAMKNELNDAWTKKYGLSLTSVQILAAVIPDEDSAMIKDLQRQAIYQNRNMAGAAMVDAQAQAMKNAAQNEGGAFLGFAGMNMAMNTGGLNAGQFFNNQNVQESTKNSNVLGAWFCPNCGTKNEGNFCPKCGEKKPSNI